MEIMSVFGDLPSLGSAKTPSVGARPARATTLQGWLFRGEGRDQFVLLTSTLDQSQSVPLRQSDILEATVLSRETSIWGSDAPLVRLSVKRHATGEIEVNEAPGWNPLDSLRVPHGTCSRTWGSPERGNGEVW